PIARRWKKRATEPDRTLPMPRTIPRETCLDRAIDLFWSHGYRGTSMEMLADALAVAKPSIYANFGSKKALFLEALKNYQTSFVGRMSSHLQQGHGVRDGLHRLLCDLIAPCMLEVRQGCLATNSVSEMSNLDPDIRAQINHTFHELLRLFTEAIRRGQQLGDIRNQRPAAELATFIVSSLQGVRVLEKTSVDLSHRNGIAWLALSVLDQATDNCDRPAHRAPTKLRSPAARKTQRRQARQI
ncbi:MAG: TetR/AcrR family transcriptional regulator, partial [Gammaproteobacteria bacterium]